MRGDTKHVSKPCGKTTLSTKKILLYHFVALSMCHPVLIKLLLLQHKWISFTAAGLVLAFSISSASSCRAFKGNFSPLLTTKMKLVGCYGIARPTENWVGAWQDGCAKIHNWISNCLARWKKHLPILFWPKCHWVLSTGVKYYTILRNWSSGQWAWEQLFKSWMFICCV